MQNEKQIALYKQKKKRLTPKEKILKKKIKIAKNLALSRQSKNMFDLNIGQIENALTKHTIMISSQDTDKKNNWICQYPNDHYFFIKHKTTCNYVALFISKVYIFDGGYARRVYIRKLNSPIYLPDKAKDKFYFQLPVEDIEQMANLIK